MPPILLEQDAQLLMKMLSTKESGDSQAFLQAMEVRALVQVLDKAAPHALIDELLLEVPGEKAVGENWNVAQQQAVTSALESWARRVQTVLSIHTLFDAEERAKKAKQVKQDKPSSDPFLDIVKSEWEPSQQFSNLSLQLKLGMWDTTLPALRRNVGVADFGEQRYQRGMSSSTYYRDRLWVRLLQMRGIVSPTEIVDTFPELASSLSASVLAEGERNGRRTVENLGQFSVWTALLRGDAISSDRFGMSGVQGIGSPNIFFFRSPPIVKKDFILGVDGELHPMFPALLTLAKETERVALGVGLQSSEEWSQNWQLAINEVVTALVRKTLGDLQAAQAHDMPTAWLEFQKKLQKVIRTSENTPWIELMSLTNSVIFAGAAEASFQRSLMSDGFPLVYPESQQGLLELTGVYPAHLFAHRISAAQMARNQYEFLLGDYLPAGDEGWYRKYPTRNLGIMRAAGPRTDGYNWGDYHWEQNKGMLPAIQETVQKIEQVLPPVPKVDKVPDNAWIRGFTLLLVALDQPLSFLRQPGRQELIRELYYQLLHFYEKVNVYGGDGFYGDYWKRCMEALRTAMVEWQMPVENDVRLQAGEAIVLLGSNGGGKTTLLAAIAQALEPVGNVLARKAVLPAEQLLFLPSVDLVEVETLSGIRASGNSSFMLAAQQLIDRLQARQEYLGAPLLMGDEIGRRTDTLNELALLGAEIIVNYKRFGYALLSSHGNGMARVLAPVLEKLGIPVQWKTMHNFRLESVGSEPVESKAWEASRAFLPDSFLSSLATKLGIPDSAEKLEEIKKNTVEFNLEWAFTESLKQVGWIDENGNFDGLLAVLLGLSGAKSKLWYPKHEFLLERELYGNNSHLVEFLFDSVEGNPTRVPEYLRELSDQSLRIQVEQLLLPAKLLSDIRSYFRQIESGYSAHEDDGRQQSLRTKQQQLALLWKQQQSVFDEVQQRLPGVLSADYFEKVTQFLNGPFSSSMGENISLFPSVHMAALLAIVAAKEQLELRPAFIEGTASTLEMSGALNSLLAYTENRFSRSSLEIRDQAKAVRNDFKLSKSVFVTGPQGSGKTEMLVTVSETVLLAQYFGYSFGQQAKVSKDWFVLPLFTVPKVAEDKVTRPLSSFEKEVRHRLAAVLQVSEQLPAHRRLLVIMDEPCATTNTHEASAILQELKKVVEGKGGKLIIATHSHETIWDLEEGNEPFVALQVGFRGTSKAFQWYDGHGPSSGVEVVELMGADKEFVQLASYIRDYLTEVRKEHPSEDQISRLVEKIQPFL